MGNFDKCLPYILKEEGGNDDDPRDHGGRTSRGVTQHVYDAFRAKEGLPPNDVWKATNDEIKTIYQTQYWYPYCDHLPAGIDLCFFDTSVNAGRQQAVKTLQRALGINPDGMMGMVTLNTVATHADIPALIWAYSDKRRAFYRANAQFSTYGRGWLGRVDRIQSAALAMVPVASRAPAAAPTEQSPPSPKPEPEPEPESRSPKANPNNPSQAPLSTETSSAITVGSGGLTGTLQSIKDSLGPFADTIKYVQYILLGITIAGVALMIWSFYKQRKAQQVQ